MVPRTARSIRNDLWGHMGWWVCRRVAHSLFQAGHRLLLWSLYASLMVLLAAGCILVSPLDLAAQAPPGSGEAILVASGIDPRVPPAITVDSRGQVYLVWQEPYASPGLSRLQMATWPYTTFSTFARFRESPGSSALSTFWKPLQAGACERLAVAWSDGASDEASVFAGTRGDKPISWAPGQARAWAFALDDTQVLSVAWWAGESLVVEQPANGSVMSFSREGDGIVRDLILSYGTDGTGYLIWSETDAEEAPAGIWAVPLVPDGQTVAVTGSGVLKGAAVDGAGAVHVAWVDQEGLWLGNAVDPEGASLVRAGVAVEAPVAVAAGPDGYVHLVWAEDGMLHYALSADWAATHSELPGANVTALALAVDADNRPHITWVEQPPDAEAKLLLVEPPPAPPMVAVTWPPAGETVLPDGDVRAGTNLAPAAWDSVTLYLQPVDERGDRAPMRELGTDTDGADGWSAPLPGVPAAGLVRVVAIGRDRYGRIARAFGEPFMLLAADLPVLREQSAPAAGAAGVLRLALPAASDWAGVDAADVFLAPFSAESVAGSDTGGTDAYYAGYLPLENSSSGTNLSLDTRSVPDGVYKVQLKREGADGTSLMAQTAGIVSIDNLRAPRVNAVHWRQGLESDRFGLVAEMDALHHPPVQVEFFLQSVAEGVHTGDAAVSGELVWLGTDSSAEGGWSIDAPLDPRWRDGCWVGWAIACDARGLCGTGATEMELLASDERASLLFAAPGSGRDVSGQVTIGLYPEDATANVSWAQAYLESEDGTFTSLGYLKPDSHGWQSVWDSRLVPDGTYRLLLQARLQSGRTIPFWSSRFQVSNSIGGWRLHMSPDMQPSSGMVRLSVEGGALDSVNGVSFYLSDASGAILPIGRAVVGAQGWDALWNTYDVLDGHYVLVAALAGVDGRLSHIEMPVEVRNDRLSTRFLRTPGDGPVQGRTAIAWQSSPDVGQVTVALDYSADGGNTWMSAARELASSGSLQWDSETVPDSDQAWLRLTAQRAGWTATAVFGPFVVNNVNEPPLLSILWPATGEVVSGVTEVRWAARDPDGHSVTVDLLVRRGDGPWVPLASGLEPSGVYPWNTAGLVPGERYTLRAIARDTAGGSSIDAIQDLLVVANRAPQVTLIWPNRGARLEDSTAILWRAHDPDGDRLTIDVYYSDNDGLTWYALAKNLEDVGYYVWEVSFLPPGANYRLRVVAKDAYAVGYDQSEESIQVRGESLPAVHLVQPWAGSVLRDTVRLGWQPAFPLGGDAVADLLIRAAGESDWQSLAAGVRYADYYLWDTTAVPDGTYDLALQVRRGSEQRISNILPRVSVANEQVRSSLSLEAPRSGELLSGRRLARWSCEGCEPGAPAIIELSPDGGASWSSLITVPAAHGRYVWDTDAWPAGMDYALRVTVAGADGEERSASATRLALGGRGLLPPRVEADALAGQGEQGVVVSWDAMSGDGRPIDVSLALCRAGGGDCSVVSDRLAASGQHRFDPSNAGLARVIASNALFSVEVCAQWAAPARGVEGLDLQLVDPSGGGERVGSVPVTWKATSAGDEPVAITLEYSRDGGQSWRLIIEDLENIGRYLWQTTLLPNGVYRIRVTARSSSSTAVRTSEPFMLNTPGRSLPLVSLQARGASLGALGSRALLWSAADAEGSPLTVRIVYGLSPEGPWQVLAEGDGASCIDGFSGAALPNTEIWLKLLATDGVLEASSAVVGPLSVANAGAPRVRLLSPAGGEVWSGQQSVAWASMGGVGAPTVTLAYSLDGGDTWSQLASGLPAVGRRIWDAATVRPGSAVLFRAEARSGNTLGVVQTERPVIIVDSGEVRGAQDGIR